MSVRLLQVSDCHLAADPAAGYRGQSAQANLEALSGAVTAFGPDLLVLTGDLSEDASEASYRRLVDWAQSFHVPVCWIPGNHDDRSVMTPIFAEAGWHEGPVIDLPMTGSPQTTWQLVLLDSAWVDEPAGRLTEDRLEVWSRVDRARPAGVFVHHQPIPVGAAWIDKVPLDPPDPLWQAVNAAGNVRFIGFGHVHQRFRARRHGVDCLAAPSTAANSLPRTERFTAGEKTPMARWYTLHADTGFNSGLLSARE